MKLYWLLPLCAIAVACGGGGASNGAPVSPYTTTTTTGGSTTTTGTTGGTTGVPNLGADASLNGKKIFPATDPWNTAIDSAEVDPNSENLIASIGNDVGLHPDFGANWDGGPFGIPYIVVPGTQKKVGVTFQYADESDKGPYPIPLNAPIEGGASSTGDRHVIVIDRDNWILYELWDAYPQKSGNWTAGSGAIFNLKTDTIRPAGWTSADAAGLPILPGLVRYDEVHAGAIDHALRFTVQTTRHAYVAPARHYASSNTSTNVPPMGMRVRLKASFDISKFPADAQVILKALKKYGMIVADNGSNWYISGVPDSRWSDDDMNTLKSIKGSNFEVVKMGAVTTN